MAVTISVNVLRQQGFGINPPQTANPPYPPSGFQDIATNTIQNIVQYQGVQPGVNAIIRVIYQNARQQQFKGSYYVNQTVAQVHTLINTPGA